ncbi:MAG: M13 family metallopeptidase [Eubacteriales bacterium]|nr:M13 family metallopeptidase [Eubacteriales bacterium]
MKKRGTKKTAISLTLIGAVMLGLFGCGVVEEKIVTTEQQSTQADVQKAEDEMRPQDDFYGYVNRDSIRSYALNYKDSSAGAFDDVQNTVNQEIISMVKDIANSDEAYEEGSNEWTVKQTYNQLIGYMEQNTDAAKKDYMEFVDKVNAISTKEEALDALGDLKNEYGIFNFISIDVDTDYRKSDQNALYIFQKNYVFGEILEDFYEENSVRKSLYAFVIDMLVMSGKSVEEARELAEEYLYYLVDVACETDFSLLKAADPYSTVQYYSNQELNNMLSGITMEEIMKGLQKESPYDGWYVQDVNQLCAMLKAFDEENLDVIKTYLLCAYVYEYKQFLLEDYDVLNAYTTPFNADMEAEVEECLIQILDPQISELYADYYFTEEMEQQLVAMQLDIVCGYEQLIHDADWLSEKGKDELLNKLHNITFVYGGGKKCLTKQDNLAIIGDDFYETYVNAKVFKYNKFERMIGKTPDREIADMSSYIVNAQFESSNIFTITVGMMHAPFFDVNASYEKNLGGLGMVIGHEIGHAFDSNCIKFDADGNYNENWLPESDLEQLSERLKQMEDYYSGYTVMDIYHVDGTLTAGENYADIGAMECLMAIVSDTDGRKRLFENYARIWCEYIEDSTLMEKLVYDEHSPSEIRVNAVLASTPAFYEIYDVKPDDGMYVAPEQRVSRW